MAHLDEPGTESVPGRFIELTPAARRTAESAERRRLALERLVDAIESDLADDSLDDERTLQTIGERLAGFRDG